MASDGSAASERRDPKCPICGRRSDPAVRPFCSRRCADVDLARWLGGRYAIAAREDDDEDETVTPDSLSRHSLDDPDEDD